MNEDYSFDVDLEDLRKKQYEQSQQNLAQGNKADFSENAREAYRTYGSGSGENQGMAGGMLQGAAAGSAFGPEAAAVGAGLGAFSGAMREREARKKYNREMAYQSEVMKQNQQMSALSNLIQMSRSATL